MCGGPLRAGNFPRKPRGALIAPAGEAFLVRFSLCCGREGCREHATPPSLRFLGRRVYLGVVVIVTSLVAQAIGAAHHILAAVRKVHNAIKLYSAALPDTISPGGAPDDEIPF